MPQLRPRFAVAFLVALVAGVLHVSALAAAPSELHQRLVRFDREIAGHLAALSLSEPLASATTRRRLAGALGALEQEIAAERDLPDRAALVAKCQRLRRRVADLERAARVESPAPTLSRRPRPMPLLGLAGGPAAAFAPPGNDACENALELASGATASGSLIEATNDGQATCGSSLFAGDAWYRFTPPTFDYYSLDTLGSNFDTVVSLHQGCPGTLENQRACNDDGLGLASALTFYAYSGEPVWIRVAGYGGDRGLFQLHLGTGGTVTGVVRAADTGALRSNVEVYLYRAGSYYPEASGTTGADGRYTIADVGAGHYYVWTQRQGDYLATPHGGCPLGADSCHTSAPPSVVIGATGVLAGIDIQQRRGGALSGRVTRSSNGSAIPDLSVVATDATTGNSVQWAVSDASGNYRLGALPGGSFIVYTSDSRFQNEAWPNTPCGYSCYGLGTPIALASGGAIGALDFALDEFGSLGGRVSDQLTGAPIADAEVEIYSSAGYWEGYAYTNAAGNYTLAGLEAGSFRAVASGPYFGSHGNELYRELPCGEDCSVSSGTPIPVALNAATTGIDFTLSLRGTLSGRVTSSSGTGLDGVWLRLHNENGYLTTSTLTDANGYYSFGSLFAARYFLRTSNSVGWLDELFDDLPCPGNCNATAGTPIELRDGQSSVANFSLAVGATIAGSVTESGTGVGLGSGSVVVWNASGAIVTEIYQPTNGSFSIGGLAGGTYFLSTRNNPSHRDELWNDLACEPSCAVTSGTPIVLALGSSITRHFVLDRQGSIEGRVTAQGSGQALAYWDVLLHSEGGQLLRSTSTDATGLYRFQGLAAGSYRVRTSDYGDYVDELYANLPCEPSCSVASGNPVTVGASGTTTGIDFALAPFAQIRGTVRNASDAAPLASAFVRVYGSTGQSYDYAYTSFDGSYLLAVPPGVYYLTASRSGYAPELWQELPCGLNQYGEAACDARAGTPVPVTDGGLAAGIDFTLTPNGALSGSVTDGVTGQPIDARVQVWTATGAEAAYVYVDTSNGLFTASNLAPGTYYLTTYNFAGYIDELWSDLPCINGPPSGCKVSRGTPVVVTSSGTTRNLHLRLERFGGAANTGIAGQVTDGATGAPLVGITVDAWDAYGEHRGTAVTSPNGSYRLALSGGPFYISTDNAQGLTNQVWPGLPCPGGSAYSGACDPTTGTPVTLPATGGVDFELMPPTAIFSDGFESGNTAGWSVVVP